MTVDVNGSKSISYVIVFVKSYKTSLIQIQADKNYQTTTVKSYCKYLRCFFLLPCKGNLRFLNVSF